MPEKLKKFLEVVKYFGLRKLYYLSLDLGEVLRQFFRDLGGGDRRFQQTLVKRRISRLIINYYDGDKWHNINTTQYFLGFSLIHYALARNLRPQNILCIGSRRGFIPAVLALACRDNGRGHVDFVDAGYGPEKSDKYWGGVGFWQDRDAARHFARLNLARQITTYVMTTSQFAQKYKAKRYEYIYVDGDHSYQGVRRDFRLFWPRLAKGGFMVFHDVIARGWEGKGEFGVWRFWQEVRLGHKITFPFPWKSGLGLLQKEE